MISVVSTSASVTNGGTMVCVTVQGLRVNAGAFLHIGGKKYPPSTTTRNGNLTTFCFKLPPGVRGNATIAFGDGVESDSYGFDV